MNRRQFLHRAGASVAGLLVWTGLPAAAWAGLRRPTTATRHVLRPKGWFALPSGRQVQVISERHQVTCLNAAGDVLWNREALGTEAGTFNFPVAAAEGPDGTLFVLDKGNRRVQAFDATGQVTTVIGVSDSSAAGLKDLAVDGAGRLYVVDAYARKVHVLAPSGQILPDLVLGDERTSPCAVAVAPNGRIHVLDGRGAIHVYTAEGRLAGRYGPGPGGVRHARALVVDPQGRTYVAGAAAVAVFGPGGAWERDLQPYGRPVVGVSPAQLSLGADGALTIAASGVRA